MWQVIATASLVANASNTKLGACCQTQKNCDTGALNNLCGVITLHNLCISLHDAVSFLNTTVKMSQTAATSLAGSLTTIVSSAR